MHTYRTIPFILLICLTLTVNATDTLQFYGNKGYPPYQMWNEETQQAEGFSVDVFRAIAQTMGLSYKITLTEWSIARNELEMQRIDGILAMSYSYRRSEKVVFSAPYTYLTHSLFARRSSPMQNLDEMQGKEIIVIRGDIMHDYLKEKPIAKTIVTADDYESALRLLASGKHDAALLSRYHGLYAIDKCQLNNIVVSDNELLSKPLAFAVNVQNPEMAAILNEGLQIIKETGEYQKLVDHWFGVYQKQSLKEMIFPLAWYILIPLILAILAVFVWFWTLRRKVALRTHQLQVALQKKSKTEQDLVQEKSILKSLVDSIPDLIFYKDNTNCYMGSNRSFAEFMDLKLEDIPGKNDFQIFPLAEAERYNVLDAELLEKDKSAKLEMWSEDCNGKKHLLEIVKTPFHDEHGRVLGLVGICHDITTRHKNQQVLRQAKQKAEESDKLKSAFLANMSHEIRTPMNAIIGFAELLGDSDLEQELREELIAHINHNSTSLLRLIDDIIDLAKIEANELTIKAKRVNIHQIVDEVFSGTNDLLTPLQHKKIKFSLHHPEEMEALTTYTDPVRLKQILQNLVDNAFKYTEAGEIKIKYNLVDSDKLLFEVKDTGLGIPNEKHHEIFERFNKLEIDKTKLFRGTGLGLAICKNLVERLGGEIGIKSAPNVGSTFFFTLPYLPNNKTEEPGELPKRNAIKTNAHAHQILIVEDELSNFKYIQMLLRNEGYTTLHAQTGLEAIATVQMHPELKLILMDIKLPDMDGLTATREIKQRYPGLPIIAQTAFAMADDEAASREAGCDDYLKKPIRRDVLIQVIDKWVNRKEPDGR